MTNIEAIADLRYLISDDCTDTQHDYVDAIEMAIAALEKQTTIAVYDEEELHHNCTVQVLRNSTTGECSVGWWKE